jgi:hypothetical protein
MRERIHRILSSATSAHTELRLFVEVAVQGLGWASQATEIHQMMTDGAAFGADQSVVEEHKQRAEAAETFAKAQSPLGFPYLWHLASVRLWTLLEVLVEDVVAAFLETPDRLPSDSIVRNLQAPVLAFQALDANEKAETLLSLLKEKTRSALKPGVGRLEALLESVGIGGSVPDFVRRVIFELSQVRNLIVHRNAVVDRRFYASCPWIQCEVGRLFPITRDDLYLYGLAVDWYNLEIGIRVDTALGNDVDHKCMELRIKLEKRIQDILRARPVRPAHAG